MRLLFVLAIFTSSFLLFLVQPMLAKVLLPLVGGAPAMWVVTMLFFQALLLAGYGYATLTSAWAAARAQWLLHSLLLGITLAVALPLSLHLSNLGSTAQPELWITCTLLATVGLPYFMLSAHSSLIQRWYHHRFREEPYRLFSASNLGSMLGLLSYPLLIERFLPVSWQMQAWSWGFLLLAGLITLLGLSLRSAATHAEKTDSLGKVLPWRLALRVTGMAFVPSSLFLGVTLYVTTDIASLPLLWIIPLTLYLISFILVFSRYGEWWTRRAQQCHVAAMILGIIFLGMYGHVLGIFAHFLFFFVIAVSCHGQLARLKPAPQSLTAYYFWLSFGGMLGGLFNTLAPHLFDWVLEYPLILILSVFALPSKFLMPGHTTIPPRKMLIIAAAMAATIGVIWLSNTSGGIPQEQTLHQSRNFFGVSKIIRGSVATHYMHGTTTHGIQALDPAQKLQPVSYYGPVKRLLETMPDDFFAHPFGVLGLGAGTAACYGREGQIMDFFEIDQAVIDIARNPDYFTYLRDCPPAVAIHKGDGRIELTKQPAAKYSLLVLDAFSSDSVPLHLLTAEAIATYIGKLVPETGMLAFNLSNRHLVLNDFVTRAAMKNGWQGYYLEYAPHRETGIEFPSQWLIVLPPESPWKEAVLKARYRLTSPPDGTPLWTDDYSNILPAIKWRSKK